MPQRMKVAADLNSSPEDKNSTSTEIFFPLTNNSDSACEMQFGLDSLWLFIQAFPHRF